MKAARTRSIAAWGRVKAMQKGSKARYMQAESVEPGKLVPEGVEGRVPYRGPLCDFVHQLVGGRRSAWATAAVAISTTSKPKDTFHSHHARGPARKPSP